MIAKVIVYNSLWTIAAILFLLSYSNDISECKTSSLIFWGLFIQFTMIVFNIAFLCMEWAADMWQGILIAYTIVIAKFTEIVLAIVFLVKTKNRECDGKIYNAVIVEFITSVFGAFLLIIVYCSFLIYPFKLIKNRINRAPQWMLETEV